MSWILDTRGIDPTLIAGIFLIFTFYAVHPMVEFAYHRVKAYFAWRALEKRQTVEVTNYPMLGEILGAHGTWDAGRVTTTLLALFSLVCWGLELSVEFAHIEGLAYLLHQPPPVEVGVRDGLDVWLVKSRKELDYDGVWRHLPNVFRDFAKSRYYMDGSGRHSGTVNGNIIVASWYTEPDDTLFYFTGDKATAVDGLQCADEVPPKMLTVFHEGDLWGTAIECEKGPPLSSDLPLQHTDKNVPPPTVIMTGPKGKVFIVVKETSSYPNILYSTWTVGKANGTSVELQHLFHIATSGDGNCAR